MNREQQTLFDVLIGFMWIFNAVLVTINLGWGAVPMWFATFMICALLFRNNMIDKHYRWMRDHLLESLNREKKLLKMLEGKKKK